MIKQILALLIVIYIVNASYNLTQSKLMVGLSAVSYADNYDTLKNWNCQYCKNYPMKDQQVIYNRDNHLLGITGYLSNFDAFVVIFRGTDVGRDDIQGGIANIIVDVKIRKVQLKLCRNCQVHRGFYDGFKSINNTLFTNLNTLKTKYGSKKIYYGGHSLGGALAALAAIQYKTIYPSQAAQVYTYGEPRVGNRQFADFFDSKIPDAYRIVYKRDIVPHVPKIGYRHQGTQVFYSNEEMTSVQFCTGDKYFQCSNRKLYHTPSDHRMKEYLKILKIPNTTTSHFVASTGNLRHNLHI